MKNWLKAVISFLRKEWFLLVAIVVIALIILLFEFV
jgi:hypothetical protein